MPPSIKFVHVSPPIVVQIDSDNFRHVVQKLTGNGKNACETLNGNNKNCAMASDDDDPDLSLVASPNLVDHSGTPPSSISELLQLQSEQESVSTCSTSCSEDSLTGAVTGTSVDPRLQWLPEVGPPLKKLKFGVSNNRESSNYCKPATSSSSPRSSLRLQDCSSPEVQLKMDMLVSEILWHEETREFALTPQGSPPAPYIVPVPDIFHDLYDDMDEISPDWNCCTCLETLPSVFVDTIG